VIANKLSNLKVAKISVLVYFTELELELETRRDGRVTGSIISDKFNGKDELARQHKIWGLLHKKIKKAERRLILGFLAYTPEEHDAYSNSRINSSERKPIPGLEKKVKDILSTLFAEHELRLETEPDGRVGGFIVSEKFVDVDDLDRQRMIWPLLREKLTQSERAQIWGLLTFTPVEYEVYSEQRVYSKS
jgi:stress-induced morphogen